MSSVTVNITGSKQFDVNLNPSSNLPSTESESSKPRKRQRTVAHVMPNEKDKILKGFSKSIGTAIKQHAHHLYTDKFYHKLSNTQKNSISNGFNSILDLTDNDNMKDSQRKLFTEEQWTELNNLWNKRKEWISIEKGIQKGLKCIEQLAVDDVQAAYIKCLEYQMKYALNENETYFEVYGAILRLLHNNRTILSASTSQKFTEQDYVINIWARIFSSIFNDHSKNLFCKWGDSVPKESTIYKKTADTKNSSTIGDKIDLRVCYLSSGGEVVDLLCVEFAKNTSNDKYFADHRKVLREAKVNVDRFYRNRFMKARQKRTISSHCVQIAGTEGQISRVCLVDRGLYVANHVGSLRLPSSGVDLRKARSLLERLFTIKQNILSQREHFDAFEHEQAAQKKSMETKKNMKRSPYDDDFDDNSSNSSLSSYTSIPSSPTPTATLSVNDKYTSWVRASWFPPSVKKDIKYQGVWHKYLFSPSLPF